MLLKTEICKNALKSIFKKDASTSFVHESIIKLLNESDYEGLKGQELSSLLSKKTTDFSCHLIAKTSEELRSFRLSLSEAASSPFGFLVVDINEEEIK